MRNLKIKGILYKKISVSEKTPTFRVAEFVVITNDKYPEYLVFEINNENIFQLDKLSEGSRVEVVFDIRGRKYEKMGEEKFFNKLLALKVHSPNSENVVDYEDIPVDGVEMSVNKTTGEMIPVEEDFPF